MRLNPPSKIQNPKSPHGFTLVQLLLVITIIGILIALLLPAVQAAREAARQTQCKNNLKQIALGCLNHESLLKQFPAGGWGWGWTGDADRGTDWRQPGGWIYNILPYIEQQTLYDMGQGQTIPQPKYAAHTQRMSVPLSMLHCPTRRRAIAYPLIYSNGTGGIGLRNANTSPGGSLTLGHTDYAGNGGDYYTDAGCSMCNPHSPAWSTPSNPTGGPTSTSEVENPPGQMTSNALITFAKIGKLATGIFYCGSATRMADVSDGTSNTYLVGEKSLNPDNYETGSNWGDNTDALQGDNDDITRWSSWFYPIINPATDWLRPYADTPGLDNWHSFGSAHANGFQMAFCDGSVQMINYTIDPEIHRRLANRKDGLVIDGKKL